MKKVRTGLDAAMAAPRLSADVVLAVQALQEFYMQWPLETIAASRLFPEHASLLRFVIEALGEPAKAATR